MTREIDVRQSVSHPPPHQLIVWDVYGGFVGKIIAE